MLKFVRFVTLSRAFALLFTLGSALCAQLLIDTVAGGGTDDGVAAVRSRVQIGALTSAPDGSLYFPSPYRIRRIRPDGILETVAGTGFSGFSGDGGPASAATLWLPGKLVRDSSGNLLFTDHYSRIRRIVQDGTIGTIAGNGLPPVASVTEGEALSSAIAPLSVGIDGQNNLYILESGAGISRVRKISSSGKISLVAGSSTPQNYPGDDGDGGPAVAAHLTNPGFLAVDAAGTVYVGDSLYTGFVVRKIGTDGIISTFAGSPPREDPIQDGQSAASAYFRAAFSLALDPANNTLHMTGEDSLGHFGAWRVTQEGKIFLEPAVTGSIVGIGIDSTIYFQNSVYTYALPPGQPARVIAGADPYSVGEGTQARGAYINPVAMAVDSSDRLVYVQNGTCSIRRVRGNGGIETVAGTGKCASAASGGPALTTNIGFTSALSGTRDGGLLFLSPSGYLNRVDTQGQLSVVPLPLTGAFLGSDSKSNAIVGSSSGSIVKVTRGGQISTYAALSNTISGLSGPLSAMAVDASDNVICYARNGMRFSISPAGAITTSFAFVGISSAQFDSTGHEYLIVPQGQIYVYAGSSGGYIGQAFGYSGDGGPTQAAYYYYPSQLASDSAGGMYFLDSSNGAIRRISGTHPLLAPSFSAAGVLDSASYGGSTVVPGEIVTIFGQNLGYGITVAQPSGNYFPLALGSTRVLAQGQPIPLLAVTPGQVNAVLPQGLGGSTVSLQVEVDGFASPKVNLPLASAHPGLYTADSSGTGQGSLVNQDGTVNSRANPAPLGTVISLYGTGAGAMDPAPAAGYDGYLNLSAPYGNVSGTVSASIGGQTAEVLYAGGAPFLITGVFQLNARVPLNIAAGAAEIVVTIAGSVSNRVTAFVR